MNQTIGELRAPTRLMMTPGPCSLDPRVYRALSTPLVGHMDPWFTGMLIGEVQVLLRQAFQTDNRVTFPLSASGSGGIEAAVVNPLEAGDECIVAVNGAFSERMAVIAGRTPATIHRVEAPFGRAVDPHDVLRFGKGRKIKFVGVCHGETSTGVITQLDEFRKVADELGALLVVDAVATLCGVPLTSTSRELTCASAARRKPSARRRACRRLPSARAPEEVLRNRKTPVQSWYFDLTTVMNFWGKERTYHHTPPVSIVYALREALRIVFEEGLENGWRRHKQNQMSLIATSRPWALNCSSRIPTIASPTVTSVHIPAGLDDLRVRRQLLNEFGIEIAGGIGPLKHKIWRVGLMGYVSQAKHVLFFLAALEKVLLENGFRVDSGAGVGAAIRSYSEAEETAAATRQP